jgi:uncharacterized DUF497 family protein
MHGEFLAGGRSLNYIRSMQFEWDDAKSEACYRDRGFDFAYAASAFADPRRIVRADRRHSYGEDRYRLIGQIDERVFVIVYTPRRSGIRIISARKANQREVRHYEDRSDED